MIPFEDRAPEFAKDILDKDSDAFVHFYPGICFVRSLSAATSPAVGAGLASSGNTERDPVPGAAIPVPGYFGCAAADLRGWQKQWTAKRLLIDRQSRRRSRHFGPAIEKRPRPRAGSFPRFFRWAEDYTGFGQVLTS